MVIRDIKSSHLFLVIRVTFFRGSLAARRVPKNATVFLPFILSRVFLPLFFEVNLTLALRIKFNFSPQILVLKGFLMQFPTLLLESGSSSPAMQRNSSPSISGHWLRVVKQRRAGHHRGHLKRLYCRTEGCRWHRCMVGVSTLLQGSCSNATVTLNKHVSAWRCELLPIQKFFTEPENVSFYGWDSFSGEERSLVVNQGWFCMLANPATPMRHWRWFIGVL